MSRRRNYWLPAGVLLFLAGGGVAALLWQRSSTPAQRHARLAEQLERSGQGGSAAREWMIAASLDPRMPLARERLGDAFLADGAAGLATREYLAVTQLQPDRPHTYCRLAEAFAAGGQGDRALEAARYAARAEPVCPRAQRVLGGVLTDRKDAAAEAPLTAAARLDPKDATSRLALARLHLERSEFAEAEKWAREARTLQPDNPLAGWLLGRALIGREEATANGEAERVLKELLAANPGFTAPRADLATLYERKGRLLAARFELQQARIADPANPALALRLAEVADRLRDAPRGRQLRSEAQQLTRAAQRRADLQRELQEHPMDPSRTLSLANLHAEAGQYAEAIPLVERSIELLPDNPELRRLLLRLREAQSHDH